MPWFESTVKLRLLAEDEQRANGGLEAILENLASGNPELMVYDSSDAMEVPETETDADPEMACANELARRDQLFSPPFGLLEGGEVKTKSVMDIVGWVYAHAVTSGQQIARAHALFGLCVEAGIVGFKFLDLYRNVCAGDPEIFWTKLAPVDAWCHRAPDLAECLRRVHEGMRRVLAGEPLPEGEA